MDLSHCGSCVCQLVPVHQSGFTQLAGFPMQDPAQPCMNPGGSWGCAGLEASGGSAGEPWHGPAASAVSVCDRAACPMANTLCTKAERAL